MIKVAQCWDDGAYNDIRLTEILRKYNVPATFNITPSWQGEQLRDGWITPDSPSQYYFYGYKAGRVGLREMREVYSGFQLASHCMKHEHAHKVSTENFLRSALDARHFLEDMFQQDCPGFAWPYGAYTPETVKALSEAGFKYGRATCDTDDVAAYTDPMILNPSCHALDGNFYNLFKTAKENGRKAFYFWGHSYELLDSPGMWNLFEQKIKFLCDDPEVQWCNVIDLVTP